MTNEINKMAEEIKRNFGIDVKIKVYKGDWGIIAEDDVDINIFDKATGYFNENIGKLKKGFPTHIVNDIYIGDCHHADEYQDNFEIITVAKDPVFKTQNLQHYHPLTDDENPENELLLSKAISDLIVTRHLTDKNILVHCVSGLSRSVAVVWGYMIMGRRWTYNDAYRFIEERRLPKDLIVNNYFQRLLKKVAEEGLFFKENSYPPLSCQLWIR